MTQVFYHGTTTAVGISTTLLPPNVTSRLSERNRKKNLNRVFFTEDLGLAKIYAGRAVCSLGGEPIIFKVTNPLDPICMNTTSGATVWHADSANVELFC